jgi:N-acetylneuraminic acid mutarotase
MKNTLRAISVSVALFLFLLAAILIASRVSASGSWTTKAPMPTARGALGIGVVNGKLYAVGGFNNASLALTKVEAYDSVTDTWSTVAPLATPRNSTGVGVINGTLYAVGGDTDSGATGYLASMEAYDPTSNTWSPRPPMPTPRDALGVGVVNGKLYALGGQFPNGIFRSTVEAYDPVTDTWATRTPMPAARFFFGVGVVNNILYVVGGHDGSNYLSSVEAYDPVTDSWSSKAPLPTTRVGPAVAVVNDILYVIGGEGGSCGSNCSVVEAYDPATDTWSTVPSMPTGRGLVAAGTVGGTVYSVGGRNSDYLATVEAFTPESTPTPTPVCTSPPANMVSWWPGDGDANDIQGGGNGTLQNGAAFAPGKVAQAFSFDGLDDFVKVQNTANLNLTQALTIDAWVNPAVANQYGGIVEKTVADHVNTQYLLDLEGGVVFFRLIVVPDVDHRTVHSNAPIPVNTWTHIAGTWDGDTMKLFIDGVQQTETVAVSPPINSGAGPARIGSLGDNIYHFAGLIDEVEIFNRALSPQETLALYLAGSAGKCKNTDRCPDDPNKTAPGGCGCGVPDTDSDGDGIPNCTDNCPNNFNPDQTDSDGDGVGDICDSCATDPNKVSPGECGCRVADTDTDHDGTPDCFDPCPTDPNKVSPGLCGCGHVDTDTDDDGTADCSDACPNDRNKIAPGACGCGIPDTDADGDGIPNCHDNCPATFNPDQLDSNHDGIGDACTLLQFPAGGMFVIGDNVNTATGATIYFWGAQWAQNNPMSGGAAPNSFKGFENGSPQTACGASWMSQPGNSSTPPAALPQYMAVIVSSSVQKNGSVIAGNVRKIVIVKTRPGYGPSPGHAGIGEVVSTYCAAATSARVLDRFFNLRAVSEAETNLEWLSNETKRWSLRS